MSDDLFTQPVIDKPKPGQNLPEFSVSELAKGVQKTLEATFEHVRVRGEVSQPKYHSSGHLYFDLKDADAVINATCWKPRVAKLPFRLEEGMELVVTGQVTSYAKTSRYQINVESVALAGQGALLKLLQERKERLAKEGLFDAARKRALPRFPQTIGVITSETGAVIRDILHRLQDRWPVQVLLWPVAVQGETAAMQVASAIAGMNALERKPDVIIVARGGGSLEDLMPFNEEAVVRAAASSRIPLISAVGHETDTTLIDYAADVRAPTPTAAAELAVPVRHEVLLALNDRQRRLSQQLQRLVENTRLRLLALGNRVSNPARYLEGKMQALDGAIDDLRVAGKQLLQQRRQRSQLAGAKLTHPAAQLRQAQTELAHKAHRLAAITRIVTRASDRVERAGALLNGYSFQRILSQGFALVRRPDGSVVTAAKQLKNGDAVNLTFADATREAEVK